MCIYKLCKCYFISTFMHLMEKLHICVQKHLIKLQIVCPLSNVLLNTPLNVG